VDYRSVQHHGDFEWHRGPDGRVREPPLALIVPPLRVTGAADILSVIAGNPGADDRIAFYAAVLGLAEVDLGDGPVLDLGLGGEEAVALATAILRLFGQVPAQAVRARLPQLRVAVASAMRASALPEARQRQGMGVVSLDGYTVAHFGFFGLEVQTLRHVRFDGSLSAPLRREVFQMGDAVTVLPYDPKLDRVLLIEQFRTGPFGRGDPCPWTLEAIAGRIDPGETPEDAARREAVEEAGLTLGRLEKIAEYYPSPGAITEYVYSYLALCDLPDSVAGDFGKDDEAEDIRSHLVSFDAFMALVETGEIATAPLVLTALWLQRERARLRAAP
jgi:ADP-ribose pyrophosphatase